MIVNRRAFIRLAAASTAAAAFPFNPAGARTVNGIPYRKLGKTGLDVSILSVGGWDIGVKDLTDEESIRLMRTAIDEGVNFFDNAWHYHKGGSEIRMGKALRDGYRDKVILMTKHHGREPERARQHLEESLRRLQTDVIDVWQFHEVKTADEVETIYTSGVLDTVLRARDEGKVRHIGFTGHSLPSVHLEMIFRGFDWETVQMPINVVDKHYLSFTNNVLPVAEKANIGVIAMKTLAGGRLHKENILTPDQALRFAMTLPVSTVCSGMNTVDELKENVATARNFKPMEEEEMHTLLERAIPYALNGKYEWYKS